MPQLPLFPLLPVGFQFDNLFRVPDQEEPESRADTLEWFAGTETFKALYGGVERCDAELARIAGEHDKPAWLAAMGANDWTVERDLIQGRVLSDVGGQSLLQEPTQHMPKQSIRPLHVGTAQQSE